MDILDARKAAILEEVVRLYTQHVAPVSSREIVHRLAFPVSSATVRNEMTALEEAGYLEQPHVSAGRLPTPQAFRFVASQVLVTMERRTHAVLAEASSDDPMQIARALARMVGTAAFVAFGSNFSFQGFEFVLGAPELRDDGPREEFARLIDQDAAVWDERLRGALEHPIGIFIGEENPIYESPYFSIAAARLPRRGVVALVGPIRMDYVRAVSALRRFF